MTEEKFTELVNLYLDKEISQKELSELKAELADVPRRQAEFAERCRLHQAMRIAMDPEGANCSTPIRLDEEFKVAHHNRSLPRWVLGSGLAASVLIVFLLVPMAMQDNPEGGIQIQGAEELVAADPLDQIGRKELRRFAEIQELRSQNQRASLAAKFRLMGLQPELTPREKQLRTVSLAAIQPKGAEQSQAELLQNVKKLSPMPEPQILSLDSSTTNSGSTWPSGFQSSLASFSFE